MADRNERWALNHLIEMCRDEELTLRYAADHVQDPALRVLLADLASRRARFAEDLQPHARRLGGAEAADYTTGGALRRGWRKLRNKVVGYGDKQILAEAGYDEDRALATYEQSLNDMLPPTARDLIETQCAEIRQAHGHLRAHVH